ncbi:phosphatase PAP2 family protein [Endozoicomonadaceae bacterium StTr2]
MSYSPSDYELINLLQSALEPLNQIMVWLAWAGYSQSYLLVIAIIYWTVCPRQALRLGCIISINCLVFAFIKVCLKGPRPYHADPSLLRGPLESDNGMPSGHTQTATVFFGYLAVQLRRPIFWLLAVATVATIAVSRLYLGVHFADQIFAGLLSGIVILLLFLWLEQPVTNVIMSMPLSQALIFVTAVSLLLSLIHIAVGVTATLSWRSIGLLTGMAAGGLVAFHFGLFDGHRRTGIKVLQAIVGLVAVIWFWNAMKAGSRELSLPAKDGWILVQGLIAALWVTCIWPACTRFACLQLKKRRSSEVA